MGGGHWQRGQLKFKCEAEIKIFFCNDESPRKPRKPIRQKKNAAGRDKSENKRIEFAYVI